MWDKKQIAHKHTSLTRQNVHLLYLTKAWSHVKTSTVCQRGILTWRSRFNLFRFSVHMWKMNWILKSFTCENVNFLCGHFHSYVGGGGIWFNVLSPVSLQSGGSDVEAVGADPTWLQLSWKENTQLSCWWCSEGQTVRGELYLSVLLRESTAGVSIKRFPIGDSNDFSLFNFHFLSGLHLSCRSLPLSGSLFIYSYLFGLIHLPVWVCLSPSPSCLFSQQISSQPWLAHSRDIRWQGHLLSFNLFSQSAVCVCVCFCECDRRRCWDRI